MTETFVELPPRLDADCAAAAIETAALGIGLTIRMRGSLSRFPGSVHWHFGMPARSGTVEATLIPRQRSCSISVHRNRAAPWTAQMLTLLPPAVRRALEEAADRDGAASTEATPCDR